LIATLVPRLRRPYYLQLGDLHLEEDVVLLTSRAMRGDGGLSRPCRTRASSMSKRKWSVKSRSKVTAFTVLIKAATLDARRLEEVATKVDPSAVIITIVSEVRRRP